MNIDNETIEEADVESDNSDTEPGKPESEDLNQQTTTNIAATQIDNPNQQSLALVGGEPYGKLPEDLYIPPDALEVFLETFEGPLDLLLYLIKRQNLDILNIPVSDITKQYVDYVELMKEMKLELAADYLVMAAMLAEIKSRMLLPRPVDEDDEDDPRAELVRRLQEYERFKTAAEDLDNLPRLHREIFETSVDVPELHIERPKPDVDLKELLLAFKDIVTRAEMFTHHNIVLEPLSVRERMSGVLEQLRGQQFVEFTALFSYEEGRRGVVVTFLAILELMKDALIEIVQTDSFEPIHVKVVEE